VSAARILSAHVVHHDLSRNTCGGSEITIHVQSFLAARCSVLRGHGVDGDCSPRRIVFTGRTDKTLYTMLITGYVCFSADYPKIHIGCFCWTQCARLSTALCEAVRASGPRLETTEVARGGSGRTVLKARAMTDQERIQSFLDKFRSVWRLRERLSPLCGKEEYEAIHIYFKGDKGEANWDRLVRNRERKLSEIEVYVPVRFYHLAESTG
jgi:hypothetical protein